MLWICYIVAALALLRWPGRTTGGATALLAWPLLGPWASWTVITVAASGVAAWRAWGQKEGGNGLLAHPPGAAVVLASLVCVLGGSVARVLGAVALAAAIGWLVHSHRAPSAAEAQADESEIVETADDKAPVDEPSDRPPTPPSGPGFLLHDPWLMDTAPCERCGGVITAKARKDDDPYRFVARASCNQCDLRLVGFLDDPEAAHPGLVWFEVPAEADHVA